MTLEEQPAPLLEDTPNVQELISHLQGASKRVRAIACLSLIERAKELHGFQDQCIHGLVETAHDPRNGPRTYRDFERPIAALAVAALVSLGSAKADAAALQVVQDWPLEERYDAFSWVHRLDLMSVSDLASYKAQQVAFRAKEKA